MGLDVTASLIIAAFELKAVQLVRGAMLAADIASGKGQSATPLGPDPSPDIAPRCYVQPEPVYEPRRHIRPSPRYEERRVYRTDRHEVRREPLVVPASDRSCPVAPTHPIEGPIPPVWKRLPPVEHPAPARRPIKVARHQPDIRNKGIVVDLHV